MPKTLTRALLQEMTAPSFSISEVDDKPSFSCLHIWTHELGNIPISILLSRYDIQRLQDKLALAEAR